MKLLDSCFTIVDSIDNVNKVIKQLPYLHYILTYHEDQPDFIFIGFETANDRERFLSMSAELKEVEQVDEDSLQFEFNKESAEYSIRQGDNRLLKKFSAFFGR
jgi:hypothetical protein